MGATATNDRSRVARHRRFLPGAALILCACLLGCSEEDIIVDPPLYGPNTSPEAVLANVITAHEQLDAWSYDALLDDAFRFLLAYEPWETGVDRLGPEDERRAMAELFNRLDSMTLEMPHSGDRPSTHPDYPADDGYREIFVAALSARLTFSNPVGEPVVQLIDTDQSRLVFRPEPDGDGTTWTLIGWEDQTPGLRRVEDHSLSELRARYHPADHFDPVTCAGVFRSFQSAYEEQNLQRYAETLHESFRFEPYDVDEFGQPFLSRAEDLASTSNMFETVEDIETRLEHEGAIPSTYDGYSAEDGYMLIEIPAVNLRIQTRMGESGDPLLYLVERDLATFVFAPRGEAPDISWAIVHQKDAHTGGLFPTADISWSEIKNTYR